jgi:hypothetical protein
VSAVSFKGLILDIQQLFTSGFPALLYSIFTQTAPFIILGLILVGWIAIIIPVDKIRLYLGENNLRSALYAALFGLPLPVCSCSSIPIALGLKEKEASRESILSFLVSAPETSIDTIVFSWGIMGPLFAIIRPVTAFITSMFTAAVSIAERTDKNDDRHCYSASKTTACNQNSQTSGLFDHAVGLKGLLSSLKYSLLFLASKLPLLKRRVTYNKEENKIPFNTLVKRASNYGFVYTLDNLSIWFIIGLITSALIAAFLPDDIFGSIPGGRITEIIFMLIIGIPMYVCSFESTPIAAVLIMKGLSPGAALVFLLAGPATNLSTLIMLFKFFGRKFVSLYLSGIAIVSVTAGLLLNLFAEKTGYSYRINLFAKRASTQWRIITAVSSILLLIMLIMSIRRLPWQSYLKKVKSTRATLGRSLRRSIAVGIILSSASIYLASGFFTVAPGMEAFCFTFGRLSRAGIQEGIHYCLPVPFGKAEQHPVRSIHSIEIGYTLTPEVLQRWKTGILPKLEESWDSFFTNYNSDSSSSNYLLGDENQIEAKFSIHYTIKDPVSYYYRIKDNKRFIALAGENILRQSLAEMTIDDVLTTARKKITDIISADLQILLDSWNTGAEITSINIVDLHPPAETVSSFREVASAMEDRQTIIHEAYSRRESSLPAARGQSAKILEEAKALGCEMQLEAESAAVSFSLLSENNSRFPEETEFRLYLDSMKKNLAGRKKLILPAGTSTVENLNLWSTYEQ